MISPKAKKWIDKTWAALDDQQKLTALCLWILYVVDEYEKDFGPLTREKIRRLGK